MGESKKGLKRREALLAAGGMLAAPALLVGRTAPASASADMKGGARPTHYRFKLGDFEVMTVWDGGIHLDGPHPIFGQNVTQDDVAALARENFLPETRMEISFTPLIVNTGREVILFDAGNGDGRRPDAGRLAANISHSGYTPEQIDVVVLTHFHPDHIGGLMEGGAPLFANARYVTGAAEYDFWSPPEMAEGQLARVGKLVQSNVVPFAERMTFLKPGEDVVTGIQAVAAGGHTPGHMAYHLESGGHRLMLWADTTNHYVASLQRPDWHVRFDMDKEVAAATRKRLLAMVAADRIPATGYHMPFPAVGFVEVHGSAFRWVPASYQFEL